MKIIHVFEKIHHNVQVKAKIKPGKKMLSLTPFFGVEFEVKNLSSLS